ncbi:uncharacterized protein LOC109135504 [Beta vulgaris subsp. vulgaris]|uniref:uncharacterized protein LOC109135504 n=1 Tax=Beta vulgaris subsp. vulgaris TaxID=3555 RepID=UPI000900B16B|nr:uncharacterized protein LOC109135504 [Beta vulgaris subsp. vulgaris]
MTCVSSPSFSISLNGGMFGFFKGKKGLRQGDHVSPLLFVLVMEYFTRILRKMSRREDFGFHYRSGLKITHLVFADDLMMFYKGELRSMMLLIRALKTFYRASGLQANKDKSAIYFGNVTEEIQQRIIQVSGFTKGQFPFRYLGVPITSKRLTIANCDVLVDRIMRRVLCWTSRNLYYGARNVLINSVLLSIHTYWSQIFMLPKGVLLKIIHIVRAFLWEGNSHIHKPPLVSWDWVGKPKSKGGLGVRNCVVWNNADIGKYTWQIAQKDDSLWIKWIHSIYIRDANWWEYQPRGNVSWTWKLICRVRDLFKEAYHNNQWLDGSKAYSIKEGYKWLSGTQESVSWHHWVWIPVNTPKHAFISWLAALDRLRTRERLKMAGFRGGSWLWLRCPHHAGADFAASSSELPLLTGAPAQIG